MKRLVCGFVLITACLCCTFAGAKEKLTPDDVIARHLQSIGPADTIAAFKSRSLEGVVEHIIHTAGAGKLTGKTYLISENSRLRFVLNYGGPHYSEDFVFDGSRVQVFNSPRTVFGDFVYNQSQILRDGLLGSVLSASWPLLNVEAKQAKLSYDGLKKVDGRQLHQISYKAKKNGGGSVHLYFDPETFRHVKSLYTAEIAPPMGITDDASARQQTIRYRMEERFSNFQQVNGMTLPGTWNIHFTVDGYNSTVLEWNIKLRHADDNIAIDPRNYSGN
ncbi:MAG TPA: hypothetical protein VD837_00350 [Terriglobales bacterium]|nr:hypothetical protein [Terriglobales bacterium]